MSIKPYLTSTDPLYKTTPIVVNNEFDIIKKATQVLLCHWMLDGKINKMPSEQKILALTCYLKYGYNREAKGRLKDLLSCDDGMINIINMHLRDSGFLIFDMGNKRISYLHTDFKKLAKYIQEQEFEDVFFILKLTNE